MLKQLRVQNIILVEDSTIPFRAGLNVLSGETGSGKSAIIDGLHLVVGERADSGLIRRGCDKGIVEATFDIDHSSPILSILESGGIEHENGQDLLIKREIHASGKGRIFINNQMAHLTLLRKIGNFLVQSVGQHASQRLFSTDHHREILDLHGDLHPALKAYRKSFELENETRQKLDELVQNESQRLREIDMYQRELEELQEAALKEGEDEELFSEYSLLVNSEELATKVQEVVQALSGERQPILTILNRQKLALEHILGVDPTLSETANSFNNALLELQEVFHTLRQYHSRIQYNPERLSIINDRLSLINRLKRKYGSTVTEIQAYETQIEEKLNLLETTDEQIENLKLSLIDIQNKTNELAAELSSKREEASKLLQEALTKQLRSLNMKQANLIVEVNPQKRTLQGGDRVEFFLEPNVGEHRIPLKDGASGGEISRVLLALQTLLAGKEQIATLIFDEVDANIGGETAAIIGDKLKQISQQHQVICITHFPQVATQAAHHLQISKQEKEGRTVTEICVLEKDARLQELSRMVGSTHIPGLFEDKLKKKQSKQSSHEAALADSSTMMI